MNPPSAGPTIRWLAYAVVIGGATGVLFHPILDHPLPYGLPAAIWPSIFESVAREYPQGSHILSMVFHAAAGLLLARVCLGLGMAAAPSFLGRVCFSSAAQLTFAPGPSAAIFRGEAESGVLHAAGKY
jgi:hypothetical protein